MKGKCWITVFILGFIMFSNVISAQNSVGAMFGYQYTHTSVAEYERIDRQNYLLDSMSLSTSTHSILANISTHVALGKNVYLSLGFEYSDKGLDNVVFTDSLGWPWQTTARQKYLGISTQIGYHYQFSHSRFGIEGSTGPKMDFTVGRPNGGTLFSGPYYYFFLPFCEFNEVEISWMAEAAATCKLGPGDIRAAVSFYYGLSDVMKDPWVTGRTITAALMFGYMVKL